MVSAKERKIFSNNKLLQEQPAAKAGVKVRVSNTGTLFRKAF
jgi:hypothetical protein